MSLDIERAAARVERAAMQLEQVVALPRQVGARVRWTNGVVWERVDSDGWRPTDHEWISPDETWPSSHVASSNDWTEVNS